jgi:hypothetical protein
MDSPAARWQREVDEKIRHKIKQLQKEFEEINFLRQVADLIRSFREELLKERND